MPPRRAQGHAATKPTAGTHSAAQPTAWRAVWTAPCDPAAGQNPPAHANGARPRPRRWPQCRPAAPRVRRIRVGRRRRETPRPRLSRVRRPHRPRQPPLAWVVPSPPPPRVAPWAAAAWPRWVACTSSRAPGHPPPPVGRRRRCRRGAGDKADARCARCPTTGFQCWASAPVPPSMWGAIARGRRAHAERQPIQPFGGRAASGRERRSREGGDRRARRREVRKDGHAVPFPRRRRPSNGESRLLRRAQRTADLRVRCGQAVQGAAPSIRAGIARARREARSPWRHWWGAITGREPPCG